MDKVVIKKSQSNLLRPIGDFLRRFHLIIFFVIMVACMAAVVVLINKTLTETSDQELTSSISAGSIDQDTLVRIQALQTSDQPSVPPAIPEGRVNPFAE